MTPNRGGVIWFTGLSGSGKTTLCEHVSAKLSASMIRSHILDGDELRQNLSRDLGFCLDDRFEHVRRTTYVASSIAAHNVIVLVAVIAPLKVMRLWVRSRIEDMIEVFVDAPLNVCEMRDPKGLYKRARAGQIADFTGINSPFEAPETPDVICHTAVETIDQSATKVLDHIDAKFFGPAA